MGGLAALEARTRTASALPTETFRNVITDGGASEFLRQGRLSAFVPLMVTPVFALFLCLKVYLGHLWSASPWRKLLLLVSDVIALTIVIFEPVDQALQLLMILIMEEVSLWFDLKTNDEWLNLP